MIEILRNDCSHNTLLRLQKYFAEKGEVIQSCIAHVGLDNKTFGDAQYELLCGDDNTKKINVDFKKQTRDREYIPIELVQVSAYGEYSSWLYNDNINYVVLEYKNGDVFLIHHSVLIGLAKNYALRESVWDTCIVYRNAPNIYQKEHEYITEMLKQYSDVPPIIIRGGTIGENSIHINGAFNCDRHGQKRHSGFCLNIPLCYMENYKI